MNVKLRKLAAVVLGVSLCGVGLVPAYGAGEQEDVVEENPLISSDTSFNVDEDLTIPNVIFNSEDDLGMLPPVTTDVFEAGSTTEGNLVGPMAIGKGQVVGRVKAWKTASNGYVRKGYSKGNLSAVGGTVLGFVPGIAAMTVSGILGAVSLSAASSNVVSGETLVSYRYLYRDGQGRWTSDPNKEQYWRLGYRTGRMETYKHVIGGYQNPKTLLWTFKVKNYKKPSKVEASRNYGKSNLWLAAKGKSYVTSGASYIETSW